MSIDVADDTLSDASGDDVVDVAAVLEAGEACAERLAQAKRREERPSSSPSWLRFSICRWRADMPICKR